MHPFLCLWLGFDWPRN